MSLTSPLVLPPAGTRPRVSLCPPRVDTYGPEAVELAKAAGLYLDPWQCDALDMMLSVRADGKWACFEYCEWTARQNGKGAILEARALAGLFLLGEELIMWSAHEYKTALEAYRRLRTLVNRLIDAGLIDDKLIKFVNATYEQSIERLDTGQRVKFIARSKGSGRGFSGDVNIVDETFAYTEIMQDALMPTMNARLNPQIIYTSTPPLVGDAGEVMYALRSRAEAGGDDSLGYRDWGAGGDLDAICTAEDVRVVDEGGVDPNANKIDVDDPAVWAATNPGLGIRITWETLRRNRRSMGVVGYAREVLGIWPRQLATESAITEAMLAVWGALRDPLSGSGLNLALAVDAPPDRRTAAIACAGRRDDGRLHVQIVEHRAGMSWVVETLAALVAEYEPVAVFLDPAGPAGSLLADLAERDVKPELANARDVSQACGAFYDDVVYDRLRHLDQPALTNALHAADTRSLGDAWAWSRKDSTGDISPLVAATLAAHGFRLYGGEAGASEPWAMYV